MMNDHHDINQEIRQQLKHWPALFAKYAKPDTRRAVIQMMTTFLPFLGLWVLMFLSLSWS